MLSISDEIRREAQMEKSEQIAMNLLDTSLSAETIAEKTGVSLERIRELAQNLAEGKKGNPTH